MKTRGKERRKREERKGRGKEKKGKGRKEGRGRKVKENKQKKSLVLRAVLHRFDVNVSLCQTAIALILSLVCSANVGAALWTRILNGHREQHRHNGHPCSGKSHFSTACRQSPGSCFLRLIPHGSTSEQADFTDCCALGN